MNVLADGTSLLLSIHMDQTHFIYNILLPIERILTLSIYARHSTRSLEKKLHWIAMGLVIVLYGFGYWYYKFNDLHYASAITTGLILALLSYIHLKAFALDKTKGSVLIAFFALANLVYFTLMVSSISALQVALDISMDFAKTIGMGNLLAYSLWSVILIIGILWKRQET
jgi:hypothetical protein